MSDKILDLNQTVYELCKNNPEVVPILQELGFHDIANPAMANTAGRIMTIPKGAQMKHIDLEHIKQVFRNHGYEVKEREVAK